MSRKYRWMALVKTIFILSALSGKAKQIDYKAEIGNLHQRMEQYFLVPDSAFCRETTHPENGGNPVFYLWPLCALFHAGDEIDHLTGDPALLNRVFANFKKKTGNKRCCNG